MTRHPEIVEEIIQQLDSPRSLPGRTIKKIKHQRQDSFVEQRNRTKRTAGIPSL